LDLILDLGRSFEECTGSDTPVLDEISLRNWNNGSHVQDHITGSQSTPSIVNPTQGDTPIDSYLDSYNPEWRNNPDLSWPPQRLT
jgi:hypothetical protein